MTNRAPVERRSAIEQHIVTILVTVIAAGVMFIGSLLWTYNNKITEFGIKMEYLAQTVSDLKSQLDGMNSNYVRKDEFKDLEIRVRKIEQRGK